MRVRVSLIGIVQRDEFENVIGNADRYILWLLWQTVGGSLEDM